MAKMRSRTDSVDAPIEGAADESLTVLSLLEEMRAVRVRDSEWYKLAEYRERMVLGDFTEEYDPALIQQAAPPWDLRAPMQENVMFPALQTLVARLDQGRIDAKVWPHTPTPERIAAAEGGNLVLDAQRAAERRDMLVLSSLFWSIVHGECGIETTWDKAYGPIEAIEPVIDPADGYPVFDQLTGMPQTQYVEEYGGVRREVITTFKFWTSGEDNTEDTRWQVRERIIDKWEAKRLLMRSGIARDPTPTYHKVRGQRRRKHGVKVYELWVKKCAMVEPGMFARVVDDCVCLPPIMDADGNATKTGTGAPATAPTPSVFPFKHGRLPIAVLKCMDVDDTPHGHTVVKDAVQQQRLINVALRSILRRADIAGDARLVGCDDVIDGIDSERDGRIRLNTDQPVQDKAMWLVGAAVSESLLAIYQNIGLPSLNRVIGVSEESVSGGDQGSVSSGEQLKTASALDSQKSVPVRRRAEVAWEEADKQGLALFRENASQARLVNVTGSPVRAMYLKGADLNGTDVSLEYSSGLAMSHAGNVRNAEEGAAAGYTDPMQAGEMRQTGATTTVLDGETTQRIQRQGADALRGAPQQPLPNVPGDAAARVLRLMLGRAPPGRTMMLVQLIAAYESMPPPMAPMQAQGAAQAAPGAPKPAVTQSAQQQNEQQLPPGAALQ